MGDSFEGRQQDVPTLDESDAVMYAWFTCLHCDAEIWTGKKEVNPRCIEVKLSFSLAKRVRSTWWRGLW